MSRNGTTFWFYGASTQHRLNSTEDIGQSANYMEKKSRVKHTLVGNVGEMSFRF